MNKVMYSKYGGALLLISFPFILGILVNVYLIFVGVDGTPTGIIILLSLTNIFMGFCIFSTQLIINEDNIKGRFLIWRRNYSLFNITKVDLQEGLGNFAFAYNLKFTYKGEKVATEFFPAGFFGNHHDLNNFVLNQIIKLNPEVWIDSRISKRYKIVQNN